MLPPLTEGTTGGDWVGSPASMLSLIVRVDASIITMLMLLECQLDGFAMAPSAK
ncbi:MAG: hypothetical protein NTY17_03435 [Planctomycetia bacterium]|nr:hypothetical protein [Planctomycetia bacterium]